MLTIRTLGMILSDPHLGQGIITVYAKTMAAIDGPRLTFTYYTYRIRIR